MAVRYDAERDELSLAAGDLLWPRPRHLSTRVPVLDRGGAGMYAHTVISERRAASIEGYRSEVPLRWSGEIDGATIQLNARVDGIWREASCGWVEEVKSTVARSVPRPDPMHLQQALLYGWMQRELTQHAARVRLSYYNPWSGAESSFDHEIPSDYRDQLTARLATMLHFSRSEAARLAARAKGADEIRWPYGEMREGQREIEQWVEEGLQAGRHLLLEAPTGLGKTAPVLITALRNCARSQRRLAFATSRTAQQASRAELIVSSAPPGPRGRTVVIGARARFGEEQAHWRLADPLDPWAPPPWLLEQMDSGEVITAELLLELSEQHGVSPLQLQALAVRLADTIVGDQNLLVAPIRSPGGWFERGSGARATCLLIDEAHGLPERVRDRVGGEIAPAALREIIEGDLEHDDSLPGREARSALEQIAERLEALLHSSEEDAPPFELVELGGLEFEPIVARALSALLALRRLGGPDDLERIDTLARLQEALMQPRWIHSYIDRARGLLGWELVQSGAWLASFWKRLHQVTAFSATLQPFALAETELGLPAAETDARELGEEFGPAGLRILRCVWIETRYRRRQASLDELLESLLAAARAADGRLLVFFPSRSYLELARAGLMQRGIDAPSLGTVAGKLLDRLLRSSESPLHLALLGGRGGEGIDLPEGLYVGAAVVSLGMAPSSPRAELLRASAASDEEGLQFAYLLPAMRKVRQAAGRLLRSPTGSASLLLIDPRYASEEVEQAMPYAWQGSPIVEQREELTSLLSTG